MLTYIVSLLQKATIKVQSASPKQRADQTCLCIDNIELK